LPSAIENSPLDRALLPSWNEFPPEPSLRIDPTDPAALAGGADLGLATDLGFLDVLQELVAVDYGQLRSRAQPARLGVHPILVADVDDLVAMKLRAGRPIDLQDIAAITAHEREQRPPPDGEPPSP